MLKLLKRRGMGDELAAGLDDELSAFPMLPTILDRSASAVSTLLDGARHRKAELVSQIAALNEELRQTNVAIEAFEPVLTRLDDGYDAADDGQKSYAAAIESKRKRGDKSYPAKLEAAA